MKLNVSLRIYDIFIFDGPKKNNKKNMFKKFNDLFNHELAFQKITKGLF